MNKTMENYPNFLANYYKNIEKVEDNLIKYNEYIKSKNPNDLFWVSRTPYLETGFGFDYVTFSKNLIEVFGFNMEEAALHFRRYKELSIKYK